LSAAYTRWLQAGPVHHAATTPGHWADELAAMADMLDIEFCSI
jgi:L-arabinose isomerase